MFNAKRLIRAAPVVCAITLTPATTTASARVADGSRPAMTPEARTASAHASQATSNGSSTRCNQGTWSGCPKPITFTNPLGRSRGPGAGAGLL
jgi:hypothetical protein